MQIQALPPAIKKRAQQLEMPVLYREACKALELCATMDEGKYYADKADALAAWAKIYGSDEDSKAAARLKLRAYARMGQLAGELRPGGPGKYHLGRDPGPQSLLEEVGLSKTDARSARALSKLSRATFEKIVQENPRAPSTVAQQDLRKLAPRSESWKKFWYHPASPKCCAAFVSGLDATEIAAGLTRDEAARARLIATNLIEWLDAFEQALPK